MKNVRKDMVVFGTLDFTIHAVNSVEKYVPCVHHLILCTWPLIPKSSVQITFVVQCCICEILSVCESYSDYYDRDA